MEPEDALALHAAILAAGPSTRFGSPSRLARLDGGRDGNQAVRDPIPLGDGER